jgi:hypothetical protein
VDRSAGALDVAVERTPEPRGLVALLRDERVDQPDRVVRLEGRGSDLIPP